MSEIPTVRVGQVWADNDKRSEGRRVRVIAIEPAQPAAPHHRAVPARAVVERVDANGQAMTNGKGTVPHTRIRLDRFRPTSTGYRLIQDVQP
ncbi:hypothetical protein ABZ793_12130 [Micromonospora sp. NPDC047465]|uniref:hypothetical protein n=1 Tax=Micromonospora sp. NPDC047465 TaxID=3154813 RepID=UPI0033ED7F72